VVQKICHAMVDLTLMDVPMVIFVGLPKVNWIILAKTVQLHVPPNVMGMTCGVLEDTMN